jgi:hypothetical protein
MKKLILALLAVGSITAANAQKNSILVYGTVGVVKEDNDHGFANEDNQFSWHINPGIGYQFNDHWTVCIQGGYMFNRNEHKEPVTNLAPVIFQTDISEWSVGPFLRHTHYFNSMFAMWAQLDINYVSGHGTMGVPSGNFITNESDNYNGMQAFLTPAFAINVHDGWGLNFAFGGIGYRTTTWDHGDLFDNTNKSFLFTFGDQLNIGISKNFGCKKKHAPSEPGMDTRKMKHDDDNDE